MPAALADQHRFYRLSDEASDVNISVGGCAHQSLLFHRNSNPMFAACDSLQRDALSGGSRRMLYV